MRLIGITGKARSGKDTVAAYLAQRHGFRHLSFAGPLKAACAAALGIDLDTFLSLPKEELIEGRSFSPRVMMQRMGTEGFRHQLDDRFWLDTMELHLACYVPASATGVVISDVRFDNEADWIRERGGEVWHLYRPDAASVAAHASELGVRFAAGDTEIQNSRTVEALYEAADACLAEGRA
ncbi:MAG: hypothetical protein AAF358_13600 [Pseudomonadota bacterium]